MLLNGPLPRGPLLLAVTPAPVSSGSRKDLWEDNMAAAPDVAHMWPGLLSDASLRSLAVFLAVAYFL